MSSLFGHLATRFSKGPEDLATEALHFIIQHSETARDTFIGFARSLGVDISERLSFKTQAGGEENTVLDLVGFSLDNETPIVIEAKFWAGLTAHQPLNYLKRRLPASDPGILLFVAPERRFPTLWPELLRRCYDDGMEVREVKAVNGKVARVGSGSKTLALTSWRIVLAALLQQLEAARELDAASNVRQLQGLCDRMDAEAFIPLRSEELTATEVPRRICEYYELVENHFVQQAATQGWCSINGSSTSGGKSYYARHFSIHGLSCNIRVDYWEWANRGATPFWIRIFATSIGHREKLQAALESGNPATSLQAFPSYDEKAVEIPIFVPTDVERDEVVAAVVEQIRMIYQCIGQLEQDTDLH